MSLFFLYAASPMWIAVFVTATVIQVFAVFLCALLLWTPLGTPSDDSPGSPGSQCGEEASTGSHLLIMCKSLVERFSGWYPWHVCGAILVRFHLSYLNHGILISLLFLLNFSLNYL